MSHWTPEQVFAATWLSAALAGIGFLLRSEDPITVRKFFGTLIVFGAIGTGFGMVAYEFLDGKNKPWRVIGCGMLTGVRVLKVEDLLKVVRRLIGSGNGNGSRTHTVVRKDDRNLEKV